MATVQPQEAHTAPVAVEDSRPVEYSPMGTPWRPSAAPRGSGADWDNAREHFRLPDTNDWLERMDAFPEIFTAILSDIFRETRAERERRAGKAKIGRRPKVIEGSLDELWDMITPKYSMAPFAEAVGELMGGESTASFCRKIGLSRRTFQHMLAGNVRLEMFRLERIAAACEVSPAYFAEWRQAYVLTLVDELLAAQPNLGIKYSKAFRQAGRTGSPVLQRA